MSKPRSVQRLLGATNEAERDRAWSAFLEEFSRLILFAARRAASDHDTVMDRYAYVLDRLREDDFRRLHGFSLNGSGKFSTWLVVVVRRLCIDHHRSIHGRPRGSGAASSARAALAGALSGEVDPDELPDEGSPSPDTGVESAERRARLATALAGLSEHEQLLLTLRYVDGHSAQKVARMTGYPSRFAVHRKLKTLTETVRVRLEAMGIDE